MRKVLPPADSVVRLKITLDDTKPVIWRRIEVPITISLQALHEVIQAVMLFQNCHLFDFVIGKRGAETRYILPDPHDDFSMDDFGSTADASKTELGALLETGLTKLTYTYDFGDNWEHTILVEDVVAADPTLTYPRFIDGANRAPPDDVGGLPGFEEFLDVMANPSHPEYAHIKKWYGRNFDPKDISKAEIATRIEQLNKRPKPRKRTVAKQ